MMALFLEALFPYLTNATPPLHIGLDPSLALGFPQIVAVFCPFDSPNGQSLVSVTFPFFFFVRKNFPIRSRTGLDHFLPPPSAIGARNPLFEPWSKSFPPLFQHNIDLRYCMTPPKDKNPLFPPNQSTSCEPLLFDRSLFPPPSPIIASFFPRR